MTAFVSVFFSRSTCLVAAALAGSLFASIAVAQGPTGTRSAPPTVPSAHRTAEPPRSRITPTPVPTGRQLRSITPAETDPKAKSSGSGSSLGKVIGSLTVVVLLFLGIARFWGRRGGSIGAANRSETVRVLARRTIDQRQSLHVVRVGPRILILGSGPNGLCTLAELTDEADLAAFEPPNEPVERTERRPSARSRSFLQLLTGASGTTDDENSDARPAPAEELFDRLPGMRPPTVPPRATGPLTGTSPPRPNPTPSPDSPDADPQPERRRA